MTVEMRLIAPFRLAITRRETITTIPAREI
jgi:hypothetical protein